MHELSDSSIWTEAMMQNCFWIGIFRGGCNLEKLNLDQSNNNDESDCTTLNNIISSEKKVNKVKRPHKESVAKPLYEDSDDESPSSKKFCSGKVYLDGKFNDAMSKLIDDKRSTIKEQIEDEENFTGSSLNVSENLHLIGISKFILNKSDSKPEKPTFNQQDEEKPAKSLRKFSNHLYDNDKRESMKIQEKKIRKFTENVDDSSFFKMSKKLTDHETTTQEGTCAVSPFNKKSRRESGFEGYAASTSIISTPIMMSKQLKHNSDLSAYADRKNTIVSQISILKSLAGTNIERIEEEKHQNDD